MAHITCNFLSYVFNRAVTIDVILPTLAGPDIDWKGDVRNNSHQVREPYPLLYLLHGGINDYSTWERYTSIERYAEERQIAVVTFSAENKHYMNRSPKHEDPDKLLMDRDNFYDFVSIELPDFLTAMFPVTREPQHTYMAGLSMGGAGTLLHAFTRPECFRAVGVFSAAPHFDETDSVPAAWEAKDMLGELMRSGSPLPAIYISCGTEDFKFDEWQKSVARMESMGIILTKNIVEGYGHEWALWDMEIRKFLDWLPRDDGYARERRIRRI